MENEQLLFVEKTRVPWWQWGFLVLLTLGSAFLVYEAVTQPRSMFGGSWVPICLPIPALMTLTFGALTVVLLLTRQTVAVTDRAMYVRVRPIGVNRRFELREIEGVEPWSTLRLFAPGDPGPGGRRGLGSEWFPVYSAWTSVRVALRAVPPVVLSSTRRDELLSVLSEAIARHAAGAPQVNPSSGPIASRD